MKMERKPVDSRQSRSMSLVEAVANVLVGFMLAVATQAVLFPRLGWNVSMSDNLFVATVFTGVSILRSFMLRRLFEAFRTRG